jgi:pimeloyl-ACP methyl ester carboxylesterase
VAKNTRNHVDDLRGASRLAVDATSRVTEVVESMHTTIASGPAVLGRPLEGPVRLVNGLVYGSIRGVTRLVGAGIERALSPLAPLLGEGRPGPEREAVMAVLNGVLGDYLVETDNPLAIAMQLRRDGRPVELPPAPAEAPAPPAPAGERLLVLVHGSCMNDRQWERQGHDHGAALARDLGFTPLYVLYNSGLHVSTNGQALAGLLERLVTHWTTPIEELVLLGHSMGGLVARSACHYGADAAWRQKLTRLVCLGTPHHGAPLERGGNWIDALLPVSRYSAPLARLGKLRSAGVTDLRFGNVLDEHWSGRDRFALGPDLRREVRLPEGVLCYAIAGNTSRDGQDGLFGDGMVPVDSALGRHPEPHLTLDFPEDHQWVGYGVGHLDLLHRPEVYERLCAWLAPRAPREELPAPHGG